jgi:hypothetical protein
VRWATFLLVMLVAGSIAADAQAAKKHSKHPSYYGSVTASGQWQTHWDCVETSYTTGWQMEGLYAKTRLEDTAELNLTTGGASGHLDWNRDDICNGSLETGTCSIGLDEFILPVFLDKVKGGLRVDFQLSLALGSPCGARAGAAAYGSGFESLNRVTREPQGFIPKKKIGKKVIVVPLSGNDSGTGPGRSFSGQMSGTLRLTLKKQIQALPN